jgi:hypothetical protein
MSKLPPYPPLGKARPPSWLFLYSVLADRCQVFQKGLEALDRVIVVIAFAAGLSFGRRGALRRGHY